MLGIAYFSNDLRKSIKWTKKSTKLQLADDFTQLGLSVRKKINILLSLDNILIDRPLVTCKSNLKKDIQLRIKY